MFIYNKSQNTDLMVSRISEAEVQEMSNVVGIEFSDNHIAINQHHCGFDLGFYNLNVVMLKPVRDSLGAKVLKVEENGEVFYYIVSGFLMGDKKAIQTHYHICQHMKRAGNFYSELAYAYA